MNKKHNISLSIITHENLSILICIVIGCLLHFAYDFLGKNMIAGLFAATDESVWEHVKIALWPQLGFLIFYLFYQKPNFKKFTVAGAWLLLTTFLIITSFYYTYTGIIGHHFLIIDIAIFMLAIVFGFYMFYGLMHDSKEYTLVASLLCLLTILIFAACLVGFYFYKPELGIFAPPHESYLN